MQNNIVKLEKEQSNFLENIFNDFQKYDALFNRTKFNIKSSTFSNEEFEQIPSFYNYTDTIKETIKIMEKEVFNCAFQMYERKVDLFIIINKHQKDKENYIQNILRKTFMWLHTAHSYSDKSCSKQLYIYMFMTPALKLLPTNHSVLSQNNVNTAFTYTCKHDNEIHIFREEEWFKVLIHETFHNYNLDFSKVDNGYSDQFAKKIFNLSIEFRMYESYCEFWATILNCIYFLYFENKIKTKNFTKQINICINKELEHSLFQCSKILKHNGMRYEDLYSEKDNSAFARTYKYEEKTPIISYFFFKSILLFSCNDFLKWCMKNNKDSINFSNNTTNIYQKIEDYANFIKKHSKNENFIKLMNENQDKLSQLIKKNGLNEIYNTRNLKLTIIDTT